MEDRSQHHKETIIPGTKAKQVIHEINSISSQKGHDEKNCII
jgi:hypothetical protein